MLRLEEEALHIITVLGEAVGGGNLASRIFTAATSKGVCRIVIHVISPLPVPLCLEKLRGLLEDNLMYTVIVKYEGSRPEDLCKLLKRLPRDTYFVDGDGGREFISILGREGLGWKPL